MTEPLIEKEIWGRAVLLNEELKEALMNPNTDFMTKLLFDSRFFVKKFGRQITYWSNAIFKTKLLLHEKKMSAKQLSLYIKTDEKETAELLGYLKNMSEVTEEGGKYSLNYANPFSKVFKEE